MQMPASQIEGANPPECGAPRAGANRQRLSDRGARVEATPGQRPEPACTGGPLASAYSSASAPSAPSGLGMR